ncbi:MAG: leucine-rich repeat domain-containing protein [Treponema sp.]|jgi:hypothetical protein|nr:leucine-rich repeat domain-containing protein [Treponema sp.]
MMKKLMWALLLAALCGAGAFAQTEADFEVMLTDDGAGAVIARYTGKAAQIRFPATIEGLPVRVIGTGVNDRNRVIGSTVTSVVIPEGVTEIGIRAFSDTALSSITLPKSLTSIGREAFTRSKLSSITIPGGVTKMDEAFSGCDTLKTVTISGGVTRIGVQAFYYCRALTAVTLPAGLQTIGDQAFSGCSALTTVTLPASLQSIGYEAFYYCALTAVTLPESLQTIGSNAFLSCSALTSVTYSDTIQITRLGSGVFSECPKLSLASQAAIRKLDEIAKANQGEETATPQAQGK